MAEKSFKDLADEALNHTRQGLGLLVETSDLQTAALNMPQNRDFEELVHEIVGKQKRAFELVQNAMTIEKVLMHRQAEQVKQLINKLT